ncbi:hypothetical protein D9613_008227 [Agrocybe pediades]|uniref:cystathionine gamma-lyase n=1 Tax=Agrocybe pediades TaxID=84607 RepID=A0A8H4QS94_9AGAR|nr:hypothetical protein D9613_008227 [Agrocybe pediades]
MAPGLSIPTVIDSPSIPTTTIAANGVHVVNTNGVNGVNGTAKKSQHHEEAHGFGTRAIHVGSEADPQTGAVIPSISLSTTYKQDAIGVHKGYEYSRSSNPNRDALERTLASLESGGAHGIAFSSGSATTATVLQTLGGRDAQGRPAHVISVNDVYGGTFRYMTRVAAENQGVEVEFLDLEDLGDGQSGKSREEKLRSAIKENTKLIWIESPTNPTLRLIDIPLISRIAHSHPLAQPLVLVDNTFLSPFYASPLLLGADIVMHSLTKYVNGHSDVVMGALILPARHAQGPDGGVVQKLRFMQNAIGAVPSAFDCWLAQRGAKTLALRMKAHGENALRVAKYLQSVREEGLLLPDGRRVNVVEDVVYPGLPGKEGSYERRKYELAWRVLSPHARKWVLERFGGVSVDGKSAEVLEAYGHPEGGFPFSGMIAVRLAPSVAVSQDIDVSSLSLSSTSSTPSPSEPSALTSAQTLLTTLSLFSLAESLGGVESLAEHPALMTHGSIPPKERELLGIGEGLVRLSVGVEEGSDLVEDLRSALEKIGSGIRN